ncbi:MAG: riboflavin biosynthesis protein RibF [Phycisphaeraceae bacterium]
MPQPCVVTIGNFDGVHLGHRAILSCARSLAQGRGASVKVLTFDPHPATVLRPDAAPPRLTSRPEKIELLREGGADEVVVLEPTKELLSLAPQAFIAQVCEAHQPVAFVEGRDFRFGKGRGGDLSLLESLGRSHGFEVIIVEAQEAALSDHLIAPVRSSLIRWLLAHGRVMDAGLCLGRWYSLTAPVVRGEQRGRTIGIPTANLDMAMISDRALPGDGVYAGLAVLPDGKEIAAAISVGMKPTFAGKLRVIEACLLDYDADLYARPLTLRFCRWLREQRPFAGVEELQAQLHRDVAAVRRLRDVNELQTLRSAMSAASNG